MIQITCSFDSGTKLVIFLWRSQKSLNSCDVTTIPSAFLIASFPAFSPPIKRHWKTCTRRILKTNPVKSIRKLTTFVHAWCIKYRLQNMEIQPYIFCNTNFIYAPIVSIYNTLKIVLSFCMDIYTVPYLKKTRFGCYYCSRALITFELNLWSVLNVIKMTNGTAV